MDARRAEAGRSARHQGAVLPAPLPPEVAAKVDPELARLHDLAGTVAAFEEHGLSLDGFIAASLDDWDRYEALTGGQLANGHARTRTTRIARSSSAGCADKEAYFQWQRQYLGWDLRRPPGLVLLCNGRPHPADRPWHRAC